MTVARPQPAIIPHGRCHGRVLDVVLLACCLIAGVLAGAGWKWHDGGDSRLGTRRAEVSADSLLRSGRQLLESGQQARALQTLQRAAEIAPDDPRPWQGIGEVYQKLVLVDRAEEAFREALERDSDHVPARKSLAVILHDRGEYAEAIEILRELEEELPADSWVVGELAVNALALERSQEAIDLLKKYNELEGPQPWGLTHLGRAHAQVGDVEAAEAAYREALSIDARFTLAQYWLGRLLASTGRLAESHRLLGQYRKLRDLQTRAHQLRMTLHRDPDHVPTLVELARIRYLLGRQQEALTLLERARSLAPDDDKLASLLEEVRGATRK